MVKPELGIYLGPDICILFIFSFISYCCQILLLVWDFGVGWSDSPRSQKKITGLLLVSGEMEFSADLLGFTRCWKQNLMISLYLELFDVTRLNCFVSFLNGQFPSVLKIAKVIPIYLRQSKGDYTNYRSLSLLSSSEKIIE